MGLDMYLRKSHYVKNWSHMKPEERHQVLVFKNGEKAPIKSERVCTVIEEVAYWRKANEIHNWFVENCQEGVDDCREAYVSREQLGKLLSVCNEVLADHKKAEQLLPTKSGFFFGGTEYDEWYFKSLENTRDVLTEVLAEPETNSGDYYYNSSW